MAVSAVLKKRGSHKGTETRRKAHCSNGSPLPFEQTANEANPRESKKMVGAARSPIRRLYELEARADPSLRRKRAVSSPPNSSRRAAVTPLSGLRPQVSAFKFLPAPPVNVLPAVLGCPPK
jgi:hypothetical protein